MGYYTYFDLETQGITDHERFGKDFETTCGFPLEALENDSIKWYNYESDMMQLSELYPNALFTLTGEGEERDDNWIAEIYRGKIKQVHAKISYPNIVWEPENDPRLHSPELFI